MAGCLLYFGNIRNLKLHLLFILQGSASAMMITDRTVLPNGGIVFLELQNIKKIPQPTSIQIK